MFTPSKASVTILNLNHLLKLEIVKLEISYATVKRKQRPMHQHRRNVIFAVLKLASVVTVVAFYAPKQLIQLMMVIVLLNVRRLLIGIKFAGILHILNVLSALIWLELLGEVLDWMWNTIVDVVIIKPISCLM